MFEYVAMITDWSIIMSTLLLSYITFHDCQKNDQENMKAMIRILGRRRKNGE